LAAAGAEKTVRGSCRAPAAAKAQPKRGNWFARSLIAEASLPVEGNYVPVSFVAKDWNVTPRRIRSLLAEKRLEGRREANGYWEVAYPYRFIIGTRGPELKRQRKPKRGRPKLEIAGIEHGTIQKTTLQEVRKS
jgi:hypothetical protein